MGDVVFLARPVRPLRQGPLTTLNIDPRYLESDRVLLAECEKHRRRIGGCRVKQINTPETGFVGLVEIRDGQVMAEFHRDGQSTVWRLATLLDPFNGRAA